MLHSTKTFRTSALVQSGRGRGTCDTLTGRIGSSRGVLRPNPSTKRPRARPRSWRSTTRLWPRWVRLEKLTVGTRLGDTHVIALGPEDAPSVVFLPGGNALNPTCLKWFLPLAERHRLYAPDIVGQPGLSAQTRPSSKGTGMPSGRRTSSTASAWSVRRSWASPTERP